MARKKKAAGGGGAPEWLVTFADLMSLLCCFFVLIISFSIQDEKKMQIVAGSMREAFGVQTETKRAGIIELDGVPERKFMKNPSTDPEEQETAFARQSHDQFSAQGPEANTHRVEEADIEQPRQFSTAAASLRQAWQEMPDILELSDQIIFQETDEGLDIQIVDEEGRSMFPPGSRYPYERTRLLLAKMAPLLSRMPNRIEIRRDRPLGLGPVLGARQLRARHPLGQRRRRGPLLLRRRQGRQRSPLPREPFHVGQSPHLDPPEERGSPRPAGLRALAAVPRRRRPRWCPLIPAKAGIHEESETRHGLPPARE